MLGLSDIAPCTYFLTDQRCAPTFNIFYIYLDVEFLSRKYFKIIFIFIAQILGICCNINSLFVVLRSNLENPVLNKDEIQQLKNFERNIFDYETKVINSDF